jgi:redox-sensing transcriptional repressor
LRSSDIPEVVVERLPLYLRALDLLSENKVEIISSNALGDMLEITPAQVRKDLSCFGRFGKQGKGYNVDRLHKELKSILGLKNQWRMILIGVGHLGRAILSYEGFEPQGFKIVACFDTDPNLIGKKIGNCIVQDISRLEQKLKQGDTDIVIVAVPGGKAQKVIDTLVKCGIKAILNYAPICARVPAKVNIKNVDPVVALQMLTFHLTNNKGVS